MQRRSAHIPRVLHNSSAPPRGARLVSPSRDQWDPLRSNRILILDDYPLHREILAFVIAAQGVTTVAHAGDLDSLASNLRIDVPTIALLNMMARQSNLMLRRTIAFRPSPKVIVFGLSEDDESGILAAINAGVAGVHLRSESLDDLILLIRRVASGDTFPSARVVRVLLRGLSSHVLTRTPSIRGLVLTDREAQILRMLEMGLSNREIAVELSIAVPTVKNHVHRVLTKLKVNSRAEAAALSTALWSAKGQPGN